MDMDDVEQLDLTALGGADKMVVGDMSGTDFRLANVDLSGPAGGGDTAADEVTVQGIGARRPRQTSRTDGSGGRRSTACRTTTRITGSETTDRLQVNGLAGDDTIDVAPDVADPDPDGRRPRRRRLTGRVRSGRRRGAAAAA